MTTMDDARVRTLLRSLDGPVAPRPEFTERLVAEIHAGLGEPTATLHGPSRPLHRPWPLVALASAAALVLAAVLVAARTPGPEDRVRTDVPAGTGEPATDAPAPSEPAVPTSSPSPFATTEAGRVGRPTITTSVAPSPTQPPATKTERGAESDTSGTTAAEEPGGADASIGIRLAYVSPSRTSRYGTLYVRDLSASAPAVRVADGVAWPGWAPDGSSVVVETTTDVRILSTDGTVVRTFGRGYFPSFSPDGTRLAFSRPCSDLAVCNTEVVVVGTDGSGLRSLGRGTYPSWMPGGKALLVTDVATFCDSASFDPCDGAISVVNVDGSGRRSLKVHGSFARMASTGRLAYTAGDTANREVYVSGADGSDPKVVSASPTDDLAPAWLPDGSALVYESVDGLVLVNADGTDPRDLGPGRSAAVVGIP